MNKRVYIADFLFVTICVSWCWALDFVMSHEADLNGDGMVESIRITEQGAAGEFILYIDKAKITRTFECGEAISGFSVVDINKADKYTEIAVHTPGPSDDDEYYIFWYDGKTIHEMGYLSRWPTFYGNGIVNVDSWMDFWAKRDKYVLNNKTRKLDHVPQDLYYVGVEANVRETFPIYRTKSKSDIVANLKVNSTCLILVCDTSPAKNTENWYLIKSSSGLVGWANERIVYEKLVLPLAD